MYRQHFGLKQAPFSIAPDPRYLFMSERHREALAHLLYGVGSGGGFVLLTGEIGAGKTTVCRCFLEQIPPHCNVAYIFNPRLTVEELLVSICTEFGLAAAHEDNGVPTIQDCIVPLNRHLLDSHAQGQNNILIIDEAQALSAGVLEQLRLLTNLETNERKLLQIILIGQPELRAMLARPGLEQLAQRVIARYHLDSLCASETARYITHRLRVAGSTTTLFSPALMRRIHRRARGVPRRINLLCDRALLGAYTEGKVRLDRAVVDRAAREVFGARRGYSLPTRTSRVRHVGAGVAAGIVLAGGVALWVTWAAPGVIAGLLAHPVRVAAIAASPVAAGAPFAVPNVAPNAAPNVAPAGMSALLEIDPAWDDKDQAWRALANRWGLTLSDGEPCRQAQRQGVVCYQGSGGLAEIRQLDRPGILTLRHDSGSRRHVLLLGLTKDGATLLLGDKIEHVNLLLLARYWDGEFSTLWRAPPGYQDIGSGRGIGRGRRGPEVDWLAIQLARLQGDSVPAAGQVFDRVLQGKLRQFQIAQGLAPDGKAGPLTFMRLNRMAGIDEARLQPVAQALVPASVTTSVTTPTIGSAAASRE